MPITCLKRSNLFKSKKNAERKVRWSILTNLLILFDNSQQGKRNQAKHLSEQSEKEKQRKNIFRNLKQFKLCGAHQLIADAKQFALFQKSFTQSSRKCSWEEIR